ncbi:Glycosyltransferase involved in cell wall bisynthesis [Chitinophaga costaii]|uniref:Glycosyltransferase involved in cell wall bisynthesis n=1 Tax=Chitinophaga costaii TaxID=1335309 RepID=A0A1C3ZB65_9BACT|nr:glycosyltransferase family 4 protein [Chitinophaga costaii]PUZ30299.1 glycosyltransferase family 4 protein [Chitinophaga costaii]SCB79503.1 Glycosyltransferase involved in cell wall bisynthesis [Chitinophaga costaii]
MKILYCIHTLAAPGGMQRVLTVKANYLAAKGYAVHIAVHDEACATPYFLLHNAISVHYLSAPLHQALHQLLHTLRPTIAISMGDDDQYQLWRIKDGSKKILEFHFTRHHVLHLVNGLPNGKLLRLRRIYAWLLMVRQTLCARHYDKLVLLTQGDLALWHTPANAVVIPNPLSFAPTQTAPLNTNIILAAGRFIATKGFDLLIDAFAIVASQYPGWRLHLCGGGQDEAWLREKVAHYGLSAQVSFLPFVNDMQQAMMGAAIYAFPSRYEGFGLALTEAMACGVPCVAFDCPCGPREIIHHEADGLLVPNGDVPAFAAALLRLMAAITLRQQMGAEARVKVQRFAPAQVMQQWEQLFKTLVNAA